MDYSLSRITAENIVSFRNTINYQTPIIRNQLMDYRGKNLWSVVCSAMDWVEISTHWLSYR